MTQIMISAHKIISSTRYWLHKKIFSQISQIVTVDGRFFASGRQAEVTYGRKYAGCRPFRGKANNMGKRRKTGKRAHHHCPITYTPHFQSLVTD